MISCYIVGIPGHYSVKTCGNNRIIATDFTTRDQALTWVSEYRPGWKVDH